jgi:hypothetical protein
VVHGIGRMVRQEIQGVIETFSKLERLTNFRELDRGSKRILEVICEGEGKCMYCEVKHRNGKCKLPRDPESK